MSDNRVGYAASLCTAALFAALVLRWRNDSRLPYPPGPRGYPLIGSVLDIPRDTPIWKAFISIAQKHSTCLTPVGVHIQLKTPVSRHGCAIHEIVLSGLHRFG